MNKAKSFFKSRPMSVLAISSGARDTLLGLGFLLGWDEIRSTLLWNNFNNLVPGVAGIFAGWMFLVVGIMVIIFASQRREPPIKLGLKIQGSIWIFSMLSFMIGGYWVLAVIYGIFFAFPAFYGSVWLSLRHVKE